jgi:UDP-GlcNAc:undecaprenyl-phosphate GlcNAc-1-phosphate transferase
MRTLALIGIVVGWAGLTFAYTVRLVRAPGRLPRGPNYRGVQLPLCLGVGLLPLVFWMAVFDSSWIVDPPVETNLSERVAIIYSLGLVFFAGLYDDYHAGHVRGLRRHVRELAGGRVTSGIVKMVLIVAAAVWAAASLGDGLVRILLGIPVIAGCANLWNLLDVRPGRALKWFLLAALMLVFWYARYDDLLLAAAIGSAAALLTFDLRERAMLGDAGSNVLGFIVGIALFRLLPTWGLAIALAVILVLHALAETVTLSRIIEAIPPLSWFDRLGRRFFEQDTLESGAEREDSTPT